MGKNRAKIKITEADMVALTEQINKAYSGRRNEKGELIHFSADRVRQEFNKRNANGQYRLFVNMVKKYPKAWEFDGYYKDYDKTDEENDKEFLRAVNKIPVGIRNSGDEDLIEDYLANNWPNLDIRSKAKLLKRLDAFDKKKINQAATESRKDGVDPYLADRPKFVVNGQLVDELTEEQKSGRIELDVHMPNGQTTGNGCWSCSMQMLIQGRGVKNVQQEDIRAYRPKYGSKMLEGPKFTSNHVIDKAFNADEMQNVMDMGDAAVNFAPDSMLRTLDILRINEVEVALGKKFTPEEKDSYEANAILLASQQIRKVLTEYKSPVSFTDGTHYITITGIDGDNIIYKSSTSRTFDRPEEKSLSGLVSSMLRSNHKLQFVWMQDINLSKDGKTLYGVPSNTLSVNPDGSYNMPPKLIQQDANAMKAEQEYEGFRVRLYSGKEDTANDRVERNILSDGVIKIEQAYLPKKLNINHLKGMADVRSNEAEAKLKNDTIQLLGYDPTVARQQEKKVQVDYEVRGGLHLDDIDIKKTAGDDLLASGSKARARGEKDKDDAVKDRVFNPVSPSVTMEKEREINNKYSLLQNAMGTSDAFFTPDRDNEGREYLWNKEGASIVFRLIKTREALRPILTHLGKTDPKKLEKLNEIEARYQEIMTRLTRPENAIKPEENISGWNGTEAVLPNGILFSHYFRTKKDIYDCTMLLESMSNSVSLSQDLKMPSVYEEDYDPTPLSRAVENMKFLADYEKGNLLRACSKNRDVYRSVNDIAKLPANDARSLNKPYSSANSKLKTYMDNAEGLTFSINAEYQTQGVPFSGPAPKLKSGAKKTETKKNEIKTGTKKTEVKADTKKTDTKSKKKEKTSTNKGLNINEFEIIESYNLILEDDATQVKEFTKEQIQTMDNEMDISGSIEAATERMKISFDYFTNGQFNKPGLDEAKISAEKEKIFGSYRDVGVSRTRPDDMMSTFVMWAMGELGYSFTNAIELLEGSMKEDLIQEFNKFVRDNQVKGELLTPEELSSDKSDAEKNSLRDQRKKKAIENWAKMLKKSTEKMKEYRIPDVDFTNKEAKKKYFREISFLRGVALGYNQIFIMDVFDEETQNESGKDIALRAVGGEKEFADMTSFWNEVQTFVADFGIAYSAPNIRRQIRGGDVDQTKDALKKLALRDYLFRNILKEHKGKRIGSVVENLKFFDELQRVGLEITTNEEYDDIPFHMITGYLKGKDTEGYRKKIQPVIDNRMNLLKKGTELTNATVALKLIDKIKEDAAALGIFANLPDDKDGMENFLNNGRIGDKNAKSWITDCFDTFMRYQIWVPLEKQGMKISDLFVINGKTPAENWGEKYRDIADPTDKEWMLRAEVVRAIYKGNDNVSIRNFVYDANNNLVPGNTSILTLSKDNLTKYENAVSIYKKAGTDLLAKTKTYIQTLKDSQNDKDSNFKGNKREGSEYYRSMLTSLRRAELALDTMLKDGDLEEKQFLSIMDEVASATTTYLVKSTRGKAERRGVAANARDAFSRYKHIFKELSKDMPSDLINKRTKKTIVNKNYREIASTSQVLHNLYGENGIQVLNDDAAVERLNSICYKQADIIVKLEEYLGKKPEKNADISVKDVAKMVAFGEYKKMVMRDNITTEELSNLGQRITKRVADESVNDLVNNRIFQSIAKKYQKGTLVKWTEINAKADKLCETFNKKVGEMSGQDAIDYANSPDKITLSAGKIKKQRDKYDRLGEVIAKKILIAPNNAHLLQGIAAGLIDYNEFEKLCIDQVRKDKKLDNLAKTKASLIEKIENGTYMNNVLDKTAKAVKTSVETREKQASRKNVTEKKNIVKQK